MINTVKNFINIAAKKLSIRLRWQGKGLNEKAINLDNSRTVINLDAKFLRPSEVDFLKGNFSKAKKLLKWIPKISFKSLVKEMVESDYKNLQNISSEQK